MLLVRLFLLFVFGLDVLFNFSSYLSCHNFLYALRRSKQSNIFSLGIGSKKTIDDLGDIYGKVVLVRVDFNVPIKDGLVLDTYRLERAKETIENLTKRGAKVVLMFHLGRPKGKIVQEYRIEPVIAKFSEMLGKEIKIGPDAVVGDELRELVSKMNPGEVISLQNLRFHSGEEKQDEAFAEAILNYTRAEIYVNDGSANMHGSDQVSETILPLLMQRRGLPTVLGKLVVEEFGILENFVKGGIDLALFGGSKFEKIESIKNLVSSGRVKTVFLSGAMAHLFLKAKGFELGKSKIDTELVSEAEEILALAEKRGVRIVLPVDVRLDDGSLLVIADKKGNKIADIPPERAIWDIGIITLKMLKDMMEMIPSSGRIISNGTAGWLEKGFPFDWGTNDINRMLINHPAEKLILGGEGAFAALNMLAEYQGTPEQFNMTILTAGGAALAYLAERADELTPFNYIDTK
ncbi:MAG: phosphoglycerate kinase [Candidatus Omnitrophica bacterium]|nr:phosphoglycerate kinase [Candidatus Omnitrophota bacterium]